VAAAWRIGAEKGVEQLAEIGIVDEDLDHAGADHLMEGWAGHFLNVNPRHVYLSDQLTNESRRDCLRRLLVRQGLLRAYNTGTAAACYRDGADGIADKAYIESTCTHVPSAQPNAPTAFNPPHPAH
jgi:hypothetical protein